MNFRRNFVRTNGPLSLFSGKFVWTNGTESWSKVSPETGIWETDFFTAIGADAPGAQHR